MKRSIVFLFSILISGLAHAESQDCKQQLINPNWPDDKLEMGLDCRLRETLVGDSEFSEPRLCFGIIKTSFSDFKTTFYSTYRFNPSESGGRLSTVVVDENGSASEGTISQKSSVLEVDVHKSSFEFNQKWIESTVVDMNHLNSLRFNQYDKGFFTRTLRSSAVYDCQVIH